MIRRIIQQLIIAVAAVTLFTSCGGSGKFKVSGTMSDKSSTNLYVKYYDGTKVVSGVMPARDGSFSVTLVLEEPTVVEIADKEHHVIARFYARKGENLELEINPTDPLLNKMTGSPVNERWAKVMSENASILSSKSARDINNFVADYVAEHPDDVVSTLMFLTFYDSSLDPVKADEIFCSISPDAREASVVAAYMLLSERFNSPDTQGKLADFDYRMRAIDSVVTFSAAHRPLSVIVFTDDNCARADSVVPHLKDIWRDYGGRNLQIIDIGLYPDTSVWSHVVQADSAKWIQGWVQGGLLGDELHYLGVPEVPYYIVADSTGEQIFRGASAAEVKKLLKAKLNR